jgi:hypothetical protein
LIPTPKKRLTGETGATAGMHFATDSIDLDDMGAKYSKFISFIMSNSNADDEWYERIKNNPKELK